MSQVPLDDRLIKIRREAEERDAERTAGKAGLPYLDLVKSPIQISALGLIDEPTAKKAEVAAFQFKNRVVAMSAKDPESSGAKEIIKKLEGEGNKIKLYVSSSSGLNYAWSYYKFVIKAGSNISGKVIINKERFKELFNKLDSLELTKKEINSFDFKTTPTTNLIEIIMAGALRNRVSDVHFEAEEKGARFRFRIDGALQDLIDDFPKNTYPFLVSRIKLLSNLKLNIKDSPQDGRFSIGLANKEIEMRVSVIPSEFGETIVMRVLDPDNLKANLEDLGLRPDDLEIIKTELARPNGMILNTGPTGSGKTTTLYTFLLYKRNPEIKIITIEDPIEYHLEDIEQTQTDMDAGYTFASGLRSMMRQDPDVILVGEIRDKETGEIAVQAALTGHLVFSTIHANSASGSIPRLLDLGVKAASISPALNLAIAQRLVRRLCAKCKAPAKIDAVLEGRVRKFLDSLPKKVDIGAYKEMKMFKPKGCKDCNNFGYRGRIAIFGLLQMTPELRAMVTENLTLGQVREYADKQGMVHMQQDGVLKAITGITTLEEVQEVTGPLEF